jgi:hypothetical protein
MPGSSDELDPRSMTGPERPLPIRDVGNTPSNAICRRLGFELLEASAGMEHLWSQAGATGGNRSQMR